jgi:MoaA/NifB/PqqE/SkfB family radical SAM enzyme
VITEDERKSIVQLQDRYNRKGKITINYLGHFEGKEHFGCNAGTKMIYIDAFGEVSPCVFLPMTFGNIKENSLKSIIMEMRNCFQSQDCCFINKNYELFGKYAKDKRLLNKDDSLALLKEVQFGPYSEFSRLYYGKKEKINDVSTKKEN